MIESVNSQARPRVAFVILAIAGTLALAGCNRNDNRSVGEKVDVGIAKTERAAEVAAAKTKEMLTDPKLKADLKDAGVAISAKIDDAAITAAVAARLATDADLSALRISVTTKDGVVSLKGPAPSVDAKARASVLARAVQGVNSVDNELQVRT